MPPPPGPRKRFFQQKPRNVASARVCAGIVNRRGPAYAPSMTEAKGRRRAATPPAIGTAALEAAAYQRQTRQQHAQERAQDYVEIIADLIEQTGEARAADLARHLGVSHVTVIRTVGRLQKQGLLTTRPYRSIFLTDAGRAMAVKSRQRHQTVVRFLEAIGIPPRVAQADAEGIEHHVSEESLAAFKAFLKAREN
jgi:DtxR family manganese transport transcriptional regulator